MHFCCAISRGFRTYNLQRAHFWFSEVDQFPEWQDQTRSGVFVAHHASRAGSSKKWSNFPGDENLISIPRQNRMKTIRILSGSPSPPRTRFFWISYSHNSISDRLSSHLTSRIHKNIEKHRKLSFSNQETCWVSLTQHVGTKSGFKADVSITDFMEGSEDILDRFGGKKALGDFGNGL